MKPKRILLIIFMFVFFLLMTASAVFFIEGAFRCLNCFFTGEEPNAMEWLGLLIVSIFGATVAIVYYICDTEE